MRKKFKKISMTIVVMVLGMSVMLLSVERNEWGELEFATLSSFAMGGEDGEDGESSMDGYSQMDSVKSIWQEIHPDRDGLCRTVTVTEKYVSCYGTGTLDCTPALLDYDFKIGDPGPCP